MLIIKLTLFLIVLIVLIVFFHSCIATLDLYNEATNISLQKNATYLELYQNFHTTANSFDVLASTEFDPSVMLEVKAYNLLEFQYLVKERGYCKRETFQQCLNRLAKQIPDEDKCISPPSLASGGPCDKNEKYSRIGGYCNNLKNPNYGRVRRPYQQILTSSYSDGIRDLRKSVFGEELPSPRVIGNELETSKQNNSFAKNGIIPNLAGLMLGQLITHDISNKHIYSIKGNGSPAIRCCAEDYSKPLDKKDINPNCIPVSVPSKDPFYSSIGVRCLNFVRSAPTLDNNCAISYEQVNDISAFLDLSIIYSDNATRTNLLRTHSGGLFQLNPENILPMNNPNGSYIGGDLRLGQSPQLAQQHSLLYRLHNYIATNLATINPKWNDDEIFFESRRITIGIYQHLVYYEWLPLYLGAELSKSFNLTCDKCHGYNENIDPSTTIEFGMNVFRFFHKNIPSTVQFVNEQGKLVKELALSDTIIRSLMLQDSYDDLLRGSLQQSIFDDKAGYSSELRNLLFKRLYKGQHTGTDLFMLDITRSRDVGTAAYIHYYGICLSKKIQSWDDLKPYFNPNDLKLLKTLYRAVSDVDLLVGTFLEKHGKYQIGPIGGCLVAEQFYRLRYGDRFFYTHRNSPSKFTSAQLAEIKQMNYAKLICMVTDLKTVPKQGLTVATKRDDFLQCKQVKPFNVQLFKKVTLIK